VAFHDQLVEVVGLLEPERVQREIVEDQQLDAVQLAHLLCVGVVEPGRAEPFEQLVGAFDVHRVAAPDRGVSERVVGGVGEAADELPDGFLGEAAAGAGREQRPP